MLEISIGELFVNPLLRSAKNSIYQALFEYRVLTQAAQLNIAKGYAKYDDLVCYQASLDADVEKAIINAMKRLEKETIEYWYYDLLDSTEDAIHEMKETLESLRREDNNDEK